MGPESEKREFSIPSEALFKFDYSGDKGKYETEPDRKPLMLQAMQQIMETVEACGLTRDEAFHVFRALPKFCGL